MDGPLGLQLLLNGLIWGSVYAVAGLGFQLVYRVYRFLYISYGAVYLVASYGFAYIFSHGYGPVAAASGAVLIGTLFGVLMDLAVTWQLQEHRGSREGLFIASFGLLVLTSNAMAIFFGNDVVLPEVVNGNAYTVLGIKMGPIQILQASASVTAWVGMLLALRFMKFGKKLSAFADNRELAVSLGMDASHIRLIAFSLSSMMAAIAGVLTVIDIGIRPVAGLDFVLLAAMAAIIGGMSNWIGSVVGGILLGAVRSMTTMFLSNDMIMLMTATVFFLLLLFRPQGLLGKNTRMEEE